MVPCRLFDRIGSRLRDLAVLMRLHTRDADCPDDLAADHDRQSAFGNAGVECQHAKADAPAAHGILEYPGRTAELDRGPRLLLRESNRSQLCVVETLEHDEIAARIHNRDGN